jgi:hypothetical protein
VSVKPTAKSPSYSHPSLLNSNPIFLGKLRVTNTNSNGLTIAPVSRTKRMGQLKITKASSSNAEMYFSHTKKKVHGEP